MPSALETLVKILKLEREQGFKNTAVIGGLTGFSENWSVDAHRQARKPEHHALADELVSTLRAYDAADDAARQQSVGVMLDRILNRVQPQRNPPLDAGAEDVNDLGDSFEIISEPTDLVAVRTALQDAGIDYDSAEAGFQPSVTVPLDADGAQKVMELVAALEDSDDVQDVYTNMDIPDDVAAILDDE